MSFALRGFGGFPRPRPICFSARRALSLPRKEFFQKMTDFAAIDFETANGRRTSVCSVGVVVVRGGEVVDTFYSLIRPRPNFYSRFTTAIHGLRYEDTADAPDFAEVWRQVAPRIEGLPLVAHNSPFDEGCLRAVFEAVRHALSRLPFRLHVPGGAPRLRPQPARPPVAHRLGRLRLRPCAPSSRAGRCRGLRPDRAEDPLTGAIIAERRENGPAGLVLRYRPSSSWKRISQRL